MTIPQRTIRLVIVAGMAALTLAPQSASAGFFEQLFGGLRRVFAPPPPRVETYGSAVSSFARASEPREHARERYAGPAQAFCVRTCDGRYFPVRAQPGLSAAQACHALCPAGETQLYSGSSIDYAMAADGSRYADLATAFLYRKQVVAGCTCNGRTAFGLASIDAQTDPTLRPGDVVATRQGLMAYSGDRDFTPVNSYRGFTPTQRAQLSQIKVRLPSDGAPVQSVASAPQEPERSASLNSR